MDQENVARSCAAFPDDGPIAQAGAVVGLEDCGEAGFLTRAKIVGRVNVQDTAGLVEFGLSAGFDLDGLSGLTSDTVRVSHHEIAFVFGPGLEIEDRTGEPLGDSVVEVLPPTVNIFATDADEWEGVAPLRFTHGTKLNGNGGIAIRVTFDGPFKAEVEERRMFDVKATCCRCVLGLERRRKE
jgi:hypothetical protein